MAVEETADTVYLVLPSASPAGEGRRALRPGAGDAWPAPAGAPSKPNRAPAPIVSATTAGPMTEVDRMGNLRPGTATGVYAPRGVAWQAHASLVERQEKGS